MVNLKRISWSDDVSTFLEECQGEGWTLEDMRLCVEHGSLDLYGVIYFEKLVAVMLLRNDFPDLVIVAAGGITIEKSTYRVVLPYVREYAKKNGFKKIRAYAVDKLRAKALELAGWKLEEYVYRIEVA